MIVISARITIKAEHREDALPLLQRHAELSQNEEGCISFQLYADLCDPNTFFFFEEWENQQALDRHFQTEHVKTMNENAIKYAAGKAAIKRYKVDAVDSL